MSESAPVADHCSTYSLNDSLDAAHSTPCDHTHDKACSHCEDLKDVLLNIETFLNDVKLSEELDDLRYDNHQAVQNIYA